MFLLPFIQLLLSFAAVFMTHRSTGTRTATLPAYRTPVRTRNDYSSEGIPWRKALGRSLSGHPGKHALSLTPPPSPAPDNNRSKGWVYVMGRIFCLPIFHAATFILFRPEAGCGMVEAPADTKFMVRTRERSAASRFCHTR